MNLSVREASLCDLESIIDYFHSAEPTFLFSMGIDLMKLPSKELWQKQLFSDLERPYSTKRNYYVIWEKSSVAIGHSNLSGIIFGKSAKMHLHLWNKEFRKLGIGESLLRKSLQLYFKNFCLSTLYCEPIHTNPALNKTLLKVGFKFVQSHESIPGPINYLQRVNKYELNKKTYEKNFAGI